MRDHFRPPLAQSAQKSADNHLFPCSRTANDATHEHKEAIKVGYNLRRKAVLLAVWLVSPLLLLVDRTLLGVFEPRQGAWAFVEHTAWIWLGVGVGGLVFRTVQLFFLKDVQTGLVWLLKILTDPFHDVMLYYKAPLKLLRGELVEPLSGRPAS